MIRSHFGLQKNPFDGEAPALLAHQQEVFDILKVHAQQGGLCLVLGEPGTGKSVLKQALLGFDPKRVITPVVNRTLHTCGTAAKKGSDSKHALGALLDQKLARCGNAQAVDLAAEFRVEVPLVEREQPIGTRRQGGDDDGPVLRFREDERLVEGETRAHETHARRDLVFPSGRGGAAHLRQIAARLLVAVVRADQFPTVGVRLGDEETRCTFSRS